MAASRGGAASGKPNNSSSNGASDASPDGTPSQFLLFRGLEPTVTEELLAKGVAKLYKPSRNASPSAPTTTKKGVAKVASTTGDANLGAKEGSLRRILLVRSRKTQESWRYGFAEFATVEVRCFQQYQRNIACSCFESAARNANRWGLGGEGRDSLKQSESITRLGITLVMSLSSHRSLRIGVKELTLL